MKNKIKGGYSVIISVLLIGFLLIITTSVFHMVLKEFNDNKGLGNSIKAFAGAEASQELALLKIKEKGYGIDNQIDHVISTESIILADDVTNTGAFSANKETLISYDLNVLADFDATIKYNYIELLPSNTYSIIPLFYEEEGGIGIENVSEYELSIISGDSEYLVWNLIAGNIGIGNNGDNINGSLTHGNGKQINNSSGESLFINNQSITDFLMVNNNAYLILFNGGIGNIKFQITSNDKFSKPKTKIISSAQIGKNRHNLETQYDNTEFLNMLKYAVFSN